MFSSVSGPVALGHRRLSIIDLSDAAQQPMAYADERYWMVYNGEIYNFGELRSALERACSSTRRSQAPQHSQFSSAPPAGIGVGPAAVTGPVWMAWPRPTNQNTTANPSKKMMAITLYSSNVDRLTSA